MTPRIAVLCCLTLLGCDPPPNKLNPPQRDPEIEELTEEEFKLNNLPDLPAHWRNVPEVGTDTTVGHFASSETDLVIHYDIGELAGQYASTKGYPNRKWLRAGRLDGSSFRYLLNDDGTLYVTFPAEGPANFWAKAEDQADIDYVVELLARHRRELLRANDPADSAE